MMDGMAAQRHMHSYLLNMKRAHARTHTHTAGRSMLMPSIAEWFLAAAADEMISSHSLAPRVFLSRMIRCAAFVLMVTRATARGLYCTLIIPHSFVHSFIFSCCLLTATAAFDSVRLLLRRFSFSQQLYHHHLHF